MAEAKKIGWNHEVVTTASPETYSGKEPYHKCTTCGAKGDNRGTLKHIEVKIKPVKRQGTSTGYMTGGAKPKPKSTMGWSDPSGNRASKKTAATFDRIDKKFDKK